MSAKVFGGTEGLVCLANDAVVEWLIALCESVSVHSPGAALTIIPFDDEIEQTRVVAARYGYELFEGPELEAMDEVGRAYWPDDAVKGHTMRKFCAWQTYERFLFLDADIVVLKDLACYFGAFAKSSASFAYFAADVEQVFRPGRVRERMALDYATAGFNSGIFMGERGDFSPERVLELAGEVEAIRNDFVDLFDQSFMNYCVDVSGLEKIDANALVQKYFAAAAMMRLEVGAGGELTVNDQRVAESGREVSILHWSGYSLSPLIPYRELFLRYRLPEAGLARKVPYEVVSLVRFVRSKSLEAVVRRVRSTPTRLHGWLAARGVVRWRGTSA